MERISHQLIKQGISYEYFINTFYTTYRNFCLILFRFCWQKYNEYVYCVKKTGGDEAKCKKLKQLALSICPTDWVNS